ncbi:MAG: iron ABC transporter permease, partial [Candidatus Aegiribacteria sp.]
LAGPMGSPPAWVITGLRLPRLALALLTGAALSVSGCVLQSILRNDLATPYTLGISAGAGLVAGSAIVSGLMMPVMGLVAAGTAGALLSVAIVYGLASRSGGGEYGPTLILAGVTMNLVGASVLLLFEYFSDASRILEIVRWMMGDLSVIGWSKPLFLLPAVAAGMVAVLLRTGVMNQISQGDDIAFARGVSVSRERNLLLASAALLAGSTVGAAGPIGFVGLMVPHIMRRFVGADYRYLVPASAMGGMLLMAGADALSRVVVSPAELPIGIMMSLTGGPFFLVLLLHSRRGRKG